MSTDTVDLKFDVSSPAKFSLTNVSGSVDIQAGEEGVIYVYATKRPGSGDFENTTIEIVQAEDGSVSATTRFPDLGLSLLRGKNYCDVDYLVKVPGSCDSEIKVVSCSTTVSGITGDFNLKTVSGDARLDSLSGTLKIETVSGDIAGKGVIGDLDAKTVSGDIYLEESDLNNAKVHSTSGDLKLDTRIGDGPFKFNSVSGDVDLIIPDIVGCELKLNTISGDLTTNLPVQYSSSNHGSQSMRIGDGGTRISLNSVSGDLNVSVAGGIPEQEKINFSDILSRIDSGEMTVDQALEQMKV